MKKKESNITKTDDIKSTEPGIKKAGRPAKQKVIKSPVKNEAAEPKPAEKLVPYCPCNDYLEDELSIELNHVKNTGIFVLGFVDYQQIW